MDNHEPHTLAIQFFHVFVLHEDHPLLLLFRIILNILFFGNQFVF